MNDNDSNKSLAINLTSEYPNSSTANNDQARLDNTSGKISLSSLFTPKGELRESELQSQTEPEVKQPRTSAPAVADTLKLDEIPGNSFGKHSENISLKDSQLPSPLQSFPLNRLALTRYNLLMSLLVTVGLYFVVNLFLYGALLLGVGHINILDGAAPKEKDDRALKYLAITGSGIELKPWLIANLPSNSNSAIHEAIALITSVTGTVVSDKKSSKSNTEDLEKTLRKIVMGNPLFLIWLSAEPQSGKQALASLTDDNWDATLENDENGKQKRAFLEKFINQIIAQKAGTVHWVGRLNGWIQILTVYISVLVLVLVCFRWFRQIKPLQKALANHAVLNALVIPSQDKIENSVYKPLSFMISVLPSLGFIGTVLGMGTALLHANELFTSTDKQSAIGKMTVELGFAFDTTLVALVAAILLGIVITWLKTREYEILSELMPEYALPLSVEDD